MSTTDTQVQELFKIVQNKKAEVAKAEKPSWETNCTFRPDPNSSASHNIQILAKVGDLVDIMSFLLQKEAFHKQANEALGTNVDFDWQGFTLEQWKADLKTRISKIEISKKKKELELLEGRLNKLVSPEMRMKLELEEITALLKDAK